MTWANYDIMSSIEETILRLNESPGRTRVIAGGTDQLLQLREDDVGKTFLLDISRIEEIRGITESKGFIVIGAATTISDIASSALIVEKARCLAQGAGFLGSPQIRNVATIGGNVVNAQPAADTSVPLVALEAEAQIVSPDGERTVTVEELFIGPGESRVDPCKELITFFRIPIHKGPVRSSSMVRLAKRKVFTLPTLSVAVSMELDHGGARFQAARIVAAPIGPIPWRACRAEESLKGETATQENIERASIIARSDAMPRDSLRGGSEYRKDMVGVLTSRALTEALSYVK